MKASIDIGTNTALLLVAEVTNGELKVLHEEQRIPRLGQGVDESKHLSQHAIDRVISALREYQEIIAREFPSVDSIQVTATSAVRDARNQDEFLDLVEQKTGLNIQVLGGFEEALYTFRGALSMVDGNISGPNIIIDIGGGSTEIASGGHKVEDLYSFDVGCVRFTERFLRDTPPTQEQIDSCRKAIQNTLEEYEFNFEDNASLIGVAGTVTSLAYIDKKLEKFDSNRLAGQIMSLDSIENYIQRFQYWSSQKLVNEYPIVMEGRADIFLAGLLILEVFMQRYGCKQLITSTGGIRHGAILLDK